MFDQQLANKANELRKNTLLETLDIQFYVKDVKLCASMPVCTKTMQPMALLHGGATAALAESLGSMGSALLLDLDQFHPVGTHVAANHLRAVRSGLVHAVGELLHRGRKTHVWDIRVYDEAEKLVATCQLSNMIIPAK